MIYGDLKLGKYYTIVEQISDKHGNPTHMKHKVGQYVAKSETTESLDDKYQMGTYYMFKMEDGRLETVYAGTGYISIISVN